MPRPRPRSPRWRKAAIPAPPRSCRLSPTAGCSTPPERKLFIKEKSEALREVATGQAVSGPPAGLKPVRVNNKIRRAIDSAIGGLTLLAPDPGKRLEAAQSVFKARNAALLPTVRTALERETEPRIRRALMEATPRSSSSRPTSPSSTA